MVDWHCVRVFRGCDLRVDVRWGWVWLIFTYCVGGCWVDCYCASWCGCVVLTLIVSAVFGLTWLGLLCCVGWVAVGLFCVRYFCGCWCCLYLFGVGICVFALV